MSLKDFGISTQLIIKEAHKKKYLITPLSPKKDYVLFTEPLGKKKLFLFSTLSNSSGAFGAKIANSKAIFYTILKKFDISIPTFTLSQKENALSKKTFFQKNSPLVVKPSDTNHGNGITLNITTPKALKEAIRYAQEFTKDPVILQKQVLGNDHRFMIVGYKTIAVARRVPAFVIGNGQKTIQELIEEKNKNPLRGNGHKKPLTKISLDTVKTFRPKNFLQRIPKKDELVSVLDTANLSKGGESIDLTDECLEEYKMLAEQVAQICSLPICGVDIIIPNASLPSRKTHRPYVIEVNKTPGIRMHHFPSIGKPRNVARAILDFLSRDL